MPQMEGFLPFWLRFGCGWLELAEKLLQKRDEFSFSLSRFVSLTNQCVPSPRNNIFVDFWSSKGMFETWQQSLHFSQS